jgi:hypothetical protein
MAEFPLVAIARECVIGACLARHDRVEPRYLGRFTPNTGYAPVSGFLRRINFGSGREKRENRIRCATRRQARGVNAERS